MHAHGSLPFLHMWVKAIHFYQANEKEKKKKK